MEYYKLSHTVRAYAKAHNFEFPSDLQSTCLGSVDPYGFTATKNLMKVWCKKGHNKYNAETGESLLVSPLYLEMQSTQMHGRCWINKRFYMVSKLDTCSIYHLGVECDHVKEYSTPVEFEADVILSHRRYSCEQPA